MRKKRAFRKIRKLCRKDYKGYWIWAYLLSHKADLTVHEFFGALNKYQK